MNQKHSLVYCPYLDKELQIEDTSPEHIIPLSLGGSNQFKIPVSCSLNAKLGSEIDGIVADDFLILARRISYGIKGHSGKAPELKIKYYDQNNKSMPIKAILNKEGIEKISHVEGCQYNEDAVGKVKDTNVATYIGFVAKTALAAGYYVYGEQFRKNVNHKDLRWLMLNYTSLNLSDPQKIVEIKKLKIKVDHPFTADNSSCGKAIRYFCNTLFKNASVVGFKPTTEGLIIYVGILGQYMGSVIVEANTNELLCIDDYNGGQLIVLKDRKIQHLSGRDAYAQLAAYIKGDGEEKRS